MLDVFFNLPLFEKEDYEENKVSFFKFYCSMPLLVCLVVGVVIGIQHADCSNITHY